MNEKSIFNTARKIADGAARGEYLRKACGDDIDALNRIREMLSMSEEDKGTFLKSPLVDFIETQVLEPIEISNKGRQIGPYKLLQQIGEGGMGTVWMAEQQKPIRRRVALKLIRADMGSKETIARFEAERQALAMMNHQNIAKVLDAGTTESGNPYFVMELIKGTPLTKYCDDNKLSVNERLELFEPVCNAIHHAHQKGIIHRDLKPSNILVALFDGQAVPKVIDFGLAKALEPSTHLTDKTMFTEFGRVVGSVQYMSPEQAELNSLDVDTRTDIYSLGVILYELLTGSTPLSRAEIGRHALLKSLQLIRENEPPRPSTRLSESGDAVAGISEQRKITPVKLQQILRGELDWVVMKAMDRDRGRRYETALGFGKDVSRFLNDKAVEARPASAAYKVKKYLKRHRRSVAALSAGLLMIYLIVVIPLRYYVNKAHAEGLVERVMIAGVESVEEIVQEIDENNYRTWCNPLLRQRFENEEVDPSEKLNAAIALLSEDDEMVDFVGDQLLVLPAGDFEAVRSSLAHNSLDANLNTLIDGFWVIATNSSEDPDRRFHAACALADYDPDNEYWQDEKFVQFVAGHLVGVLPSELLPWRNALRPVKGHLTIPLATIYRDDKRDVQVAGFAADTLADYLDDDDDDDDDVVHLFDLLADAKEKQFAVMFGKLDTYREEAIVLGNDEIAKSLLPVTMDWTVRFYQWESTEENQPPADWEAILDSPVLDELQTAQLDLRAGTESPPPPADKVPREHFATLATTEVTLEDAEYSLTITFDDGVRVWLDAEQVFENWAANTPTTETVTIQGQSGQHTLKVEHFQMGEGYALIVGIQHPEIAKEALAVRQANAAVMLLQMGDEENVWPLLKHSPDPRVRSYIIHWLSPRGGDPQTIIARYEQEMDVTLKRALLLCLGEFDESRLPESERKPFIETLLDVYRSDPDAGLHAAAEWLLRQWEQGEKLTAIDKELQQNEEQLTAAKDNNRQWYLNSQGQTFVILDASEFQMGSPEWEPDRWIHEMSHCRKIDRRFAIAAKEVTLGQWRVFVQANTQASPKLAEELNSQDVEAYVRTGDTPMIRMTWYEAAWYCDWLSEQEGIPEDQWCYEKNENDEYGPGMKAKTNFLELSGYRLPTEAEWEFACRAGATSSRFYGVTESLLTNYTWFVWNTDNRVTALASLKPNDFGLFNTLGNLWEWCYDARDADSIYPSDSGGVVLDLPSTDSVEADSERVVRGGAYLFGAFYSRSAFRARGLAPSRQNIRGFRPARTYNLERQDRDQ